LINNHPTEEVRPASENSNHLEIPERHSEEQRESDKKINVNKSYETATGANYQYPSSDTTATYHS